MLLVKNEVCDDEIPFFILNFYILLNQMFLIKLLVHIKVFLKA